MREILILTGPTASGKSEVCDIALEKISCRIINCDSKQVYAGLPTITAQPCLFHDLTRYRLYSYVAPENHYSVGLWLQDVQKEIMSAWDDGLLPIVTGGSGLYISSLVNGLSQIPEVSPHIRNFARETLQEIGNDAFYEMLVKMDANATQLNRNNTHKILRAFEVIKQTGTSIFTWRERFPRQPIFKDFKILVLSPEKEILYSKINRRFCDMIHSVAISEVEYLMSLSLPEHLPIMKAHGVPEIIQYLLGKIDLPQAVEIAQKNTRHYAKRQGTWFRTQMPKDSLFFESKHELTHYITSQYSHYNKDAITNSAKKPATL